MTSTGIKSLKKPPRINDGEFTERRKDIAL